MVPPTAEKVRRRQARRGWRLTSTTIKMETKDGEKADAEACRPNFWEEGLNFVEPQRFSSESASTRGARTYDPGACSLAEISKGRAQRLGWPPAGSFPEFVEEENVVMGRCAQWGPPQYPDVPTQLTRGGTRRGQGSCKASSAEDTPLEWH